MKHLLTTTVLAAFLASAAPALAQSKAELAAQNAALAERVERLESRLLTGDPAAERLMGRIDTLERTLRTLRGEIEQITYDRDSKDERIDALEGDIRELQSLATRMKIHLDAVDLVASEQGTRPAPVVDDSYVSGPPTISAVPPAPGATVRDFQLPPGEANDATKLGEIGVQRLREGDYAGAESALKQYAEFNPDAADLGETYYWLGESFYVRGQHNAAADAYIQSLKTAEAGPKAPDAMIKLAAALRETGQRIEACNALAAFDGQFPDAPQAARDKAAREAARTGC